MLILRKFRINIFMNTVVKCNFTENPKNPENSNKVIHFCSSNINKYNEVCAIFNKELPDIEIRQINIEIPELQGEPEDIVMDKLKYAISKHEGPLLVEDTSLCYNALNGLPGAYIKDFLTKLGNEGLYRLVSSYEDHSAYAQTILGLIKQDEPRLFIGKNSGKIVKPRGPKTFGWDPNFEPDGFDQTYAEMDKDVKNSISHRYKALCEMIKFLKANPEYFN
jgi:inosine triphosphate pyrophosphatase